MFSQPLPNRFLFWNYLREFLFQDLFFFLFCIFWLYWFRIFNNFFLTLIYFNILGLLVQKLLFWYILSFGFFDEANISGRDGGKVIINFLIWTNFHLICFSFFFLLFYHLFFYCCFHWRLLSGSYFCTSLNFLSIHLFDIWASFLVGRVVYFI